MEDIALHPSLAGTMAWLFVTIIVRAIGQRIPPGKLNQTVADAIFDILTLAMAWQVALSMSQAPLLKFLVREISGGATTMSEATGWSLIGGLVIGLAFLVIAIIQGRKFAKEDELASSWRPLTIFGICMLVASSFLPWFEGVAGWISAHIALPVGNAVIAGINHILTIPH